VFQVGTSARDFAVQSGYVNRQARWTWGVVGGQMPAVFGSSRTYPSDRTADATIAREHVWLLQTHRQGMGLVAYPFSRVQRLELTSGVHVISFGRETRTRLYSRSTGSLLDERTDRVRAARGIRLFESAAALVYDSSLPGPTAPVLGQRSRFEIAPTFGDVSLVTVTADYRRYFMPAPPFTLAFRVHHVGRYGPGAADGRLLPLVWTLRDLVRGYSLREAAGQPCTASACEPLTEFGTRKMLVGNVELRAPILGPFGMLRRWYALPVDAFVFADIGAFESSPDADARSTRMMLRSAGAGVRLNAGGFVFEVAGARPFDRSTRGWTVAANFRPGF
jgi:hypothetical protein